MSSQDRTKYGLTNITKVKVYGVKINKYKLTIKIIAKYVWKQKRSTDYAINKETN